MAELSWTDSEMESDSEVRQEASEDVHFVPLDLTRCNPQAQCPLFSRLPGELRDRIFELTLSEYEVEDEPYAEDTCYRRPGYFAPRRIDTALLQTCQRIYREAWFLPFTRRMYTTFLTAPDRRPPQTTNVESLKRILTTIHAIHGDVELEHIRIFAQLANLEPGHQLRSILDLPNFHPVTFTLTLRHTDWWWWEDDEPLHIASQFVKTCRFPGSLKELRFELESIERRKDQIDFIADEMTSKWRFQRKDGAYLSAQGQPKHVSRWSGSSIWGLERWLRDEARPETLDYYVVTLYFRPEKADAAATRENDPPNLRVLDKTPIDHPTSCIPVYELERLGIPPGTSAAEVLRLLNEPGGASNPDSTDWYSDEHESDYESDREYDSHDDDNLRGFEIMMNS